MDFSITDVFPYAFALLVAVPFLILLRQLIQLLSSWKNQAKTSTDTIENRTQAYERMVIFLERIKPTQLVAKFDKTLSPQEFIFLIEKTISEEFNYNAAQQLYISKNTWEEIIHSKIRMSKLLHSTYENISNETSLEEFKTLLIMNYMNEGDFVSECIERLKKEFLILHIK